MGLKYPLLLWLTVLPLSLSAFYIVLLRRSLRAPSVRFPTGLLARATPGAPLRRYLSPGLLACGTLVAMLAAAGPIIPWRTPTGIPVALALDVSRSMEETDIAPTRIDAAKTAARDFVTRMPRRSRVALITFGNYPITVVPLTDRRGEMLDAIAALRTQLRTQLGPGLLEGVRVLTGEGPPAPLPPGRDVHAVLILLSDGRASDGVTPEEAAREARRRGVRVFTVGLGTNADPSTFRSGWFGVLDEPTLRLVADVTGGRYFRAEEAGALREIYRELASAVGWTRRPLDVSAPAAGIALALLVLAVVTRVRFAPIG